MEDNGKPARQEMQTERRQFGRRKSCKPARIVLESGQEHACVAINISLGGALLVLKSDVQIDDTFTLLIEEDDFLVVCRVAHRTGKKLGVEFVRSPRRASKFGSPSQKRASAMAKCMLEN